jgi:hypothetical protein
MATNRAVFSRASRHARIYRKTGGNTYWLITRRSKGFLGKGPADETGKNIAMRDPSRRVGRAATGAGSCRCLAPLLR